VKPSPPKWGLNAMVMSICLSVRLSPDARAAAVTRDRPHRCCSTQSLFASNRKYRKTPQYNTKWQVAREA